MDCAECDEAHEVVEELVVARCDASEVFEFVEEALHLVALPVELGVVAVLSFALRSGRNHRLGAQIQDCVVEMLCVIGAVGNDIVWPETFDQFGTVDHLAPVTGAGDQPDRQTKTVGSGMQLGA